MRRYVIVLALGLASCTASQSSLPQTTTLQSALQNPSTAPTLQAFTAGVTPGFPATAVAWDITPGAGDSMWFTDGQTPGIGTITPQGNVHEYGGLPLYSRPYSIVSDASGNAWFTDAGTASVGRITLGGTIEEFTDARLAGTYPSGITIARDNSIWFIALGPKPVLATVTLGGKITAYFLASDLSPDGSLIADNGGNLWFVAQNRFGRTLIVERHADGSFTRYHTKLQPAFEPCCPNFAPKRMAIGPDGNVWFTTLDYIYKSSPANWVGDITSTGAENYYRVLNGGIHYSVYPSGITAGYGSLWFTGDDPFQLNGGLWNLSTSGTMRAFPVPYNPAGIAAGRGHHIWFTSHFGGQPSQIVEATLPD
jgi:streptogramin lyase